MLSQIDTNRCVQGGSVILLRNTVKAFVAIAIMQNISSESRIAQDSSMTNTIFYLFWGKFSITANAELLKFFGKCKDGKTRLVKVSIENGNYYH